MMATMHAAADVLAREAKFSYVGVTEDLHNYRDIKPMHKDDECDDDEDSPVFRPTMSEGRFGCLPEGVAIRRLEGLHEMLGEAIKGVLGKSLVVAGGAVCRALWSQQLNYWQDDAYGWSILDHPPDADLFLVGVGPEEAKRIINLLGESLRSVCDEIVVYRSERCITFKLEDAGTARPTRIIQVILRLYNTVSEVVHGFDLGSSAVAFYGGAIVMSSKGRFAYERGLNILDLSRRRASYEHRIRKYFDRGFGIVLPDLNMAKARAILEPDAPKSSSPVVQPHGKRGRIDLPRLSIRLKRGAIKLAAIFPRNFSTDGVERHDFRMDRGADLKQVAPAVVPSNTQALVPVAPAGTAAAHHGAGVTIVDEVVRAMGGCTGALLTIYAYAFEEALAFDEDRFMSDYDLGWNHQFRVGQVACGNLWHAMRPVVKTASLCAMTVLKRGSKMGVSANGDDAKRAPAPLPDLCTSGEPFVGLDVVLAGLCDGFASDGPPRFAKRGPNVEALVRLLGKERAAAVVARIIAGTFEGAARLAEDLVAEFAARAAVEFRFMRVEEATCLAGGGALRMEIMTPEEWYGDYYLGDNGKT